MSNTFHLHNRLGADSSASSVATLEASARDRKNQLETVILQLKKIALHLFSMTDERILDEDLED